MDNFNNGNFQTVQVIHAGVGSLGQGWAHPPLSGILSFGVSVAAELMVVLVLSHLDFSFVFRL